MCDGHSIGDDRPELDPELIARLPGHRGLSRRGVLAGIGAAAGTLALPWRAAAATQPRSFSGLAPLRLAMHVHGSWSEGLGSWEAQFAQAAASGTDVLFLTDHDSRATAYQFLKALNTVHWINSSSGTLARQDQAPSGRSIHLLAQSADAAAAEVAMTIQPQPQAFNHLRTSISGLSLKHTFGPGSLTGGARYELRIQLSYHPAGSGRPAGDYQLWYRFGADPAGRHTEGGGLIGVVTAPLPAPGTVSTLVPEWDVAALWPSMLAIDNASYGMTFAAWSPDFGGTADITVTNLSVQRGRSDPASVLADQQAILDRYGPQHPTLQTRLSIEVSRHLPDMNPFGVPQFLPDYSLDTATDHDAFYRGVVDRVHAGGGVTSWNHPFGYNGGPVLSQPQRDAKRQATFQQMRAVGVYGADLLEVGYNVRGNVDAASHLALWDTFSRDGVFLTGNGATDDHSGLPWSALVNGYTTGVWANSTTDPDLVTALSAGRAYTAHLGRWPGGALDLLVDGTVPMGKISISSAASRSLAISVDALPTGSRCEVIAGPVDYAGAVDPGTSVLASLPATRFAGGVATVSVPTTADGFYRAQIKDSSGKLIGSSNPVWLLRRPPPGGIPAARQ
jgi:hypothetical protein